ncbi:probable WRKY transcription factor protein 1 [Chelonus insularis]|uniref:probable WRKY transcription factor protein 1 n=1 Tax=Chelonus insularis TaxID=460826 RepID=UPI0015892A41|nr:probable WRKY transcription factor protein 1 [Chelonus insularis]
MTTTSHPLRRPSVSIYDYPEELNPFRDDENEEENEEPVLRRPNNTINNQSKVEKEPKNKFWTFGRSRKKRSNSFSIKSTWNGIFGKKKNVESERKPTISTVSSSYNRATYNNYPDTRSGVSRDQQEFDEAFGTLARRRKNTLDSSSRYSSSLTVNGEAGRLYDGCPQDTTTSIMGDLTPKPPARRFGQVTLKPTDQIPPLDYKDPKNYKDDSEKTPIPPKRGELRSSNRYNSTLNRSENSPKSTSTMTDENENMPEDYVFKRCNHDTVRKSNLSINSCVSMTSVYHSGRKKRRAPPPPEKKPDSLQPPKEINGIQNSEIDKETVEAITKVAENINEMTRKNLELNDDEIKTENVQPLESKDIDIKDKNIHSSEDNLPDKSIDKENNKDNKSEEVNENEETEKVEMIPVKVELVKEEESIREIVKEAEVVDDIDEVTVRKKIPENHSSNDSFSVKEEIEKIERQIKLLEAKGAMEMKHRCRTYSLTDDDDVIVRPGLQRGHFSRRSLQEHRRNFFKDLTHNSSDGVRIEIKELPREQKEIKIVRLNDYSITMAHEEKDRLGEQEPVKVIERHISEPIKQKAEFNPELNFNPIPKPRRHSALQLNCNNDNSSNNNYHNTQLSKDNNAKMSEKEEETSSL